MGRASTHIQEAHENHRISMFHSQTVLNKYFSFIFNTGFSNIGINTYPSKSPAQIK